MVTRSRIAFVGDATVGKSALVQTLLNGPSGFPKNYTMTPGCEVYSKSWKVNNRPLDFQIIDTSGQTIYREVTIDMILRSTIIVFVYDITNQESFNSLQFWLKTVRDALKERIFYGVVVANKTDLNDRIVVRPQDGASFARSNKLEFVETSALKQQDVELLFNTIGERVINRYDERVRRVSTFA